jgi:hypothetical protein
MKLAHLRPFCSIYDLLCPILEEALYPLKSNTLKPKRGVEAV